MPYSPYDVQHVEIHVHEARQSLKRKASSWLLSSSEFTTRVFLADTIGYLDEEDAKPELQSGGRRRYDDRLKC
jgi:hypothetical protein|tara:strand:- start:46 stop:264 length:219 start_codon:yes stop_codon:yes gene_type:complete